MAARCQVVLGLLLLLAAASSVSSKRQLLKKTTSTGPRVRRSIDDIMTNKNFKEQRDLLLLSFQDMQSKPSSDIYSWTALAAVHGLGIVYNGALNVTDSPMGYCHHMTILFNNWHRLYVKQFEDAVRASAAVIAKQYPSEDRARYKDAADKMMLPFWDPLAETSARLGIPYYFVQEYIQVNHPTEGKIDIRNPLYSGTFTPDIIGFMNKTGMPGKMSYERRTVRQPLKVQCLPDEGWNGECYVSDNVALNQEVKATTRSQLRSMVLSILFSQQPSWLDVGYTDQPMHFFAGHPSLELLHNSVHTMVGGWALGTMSQVPIASFDPIFWFHHNNVERLFCIFQTLYPDVWLDNVTQVLPADQLNLKAGTVLDGKTPLSPWYKAGTDPKDQIFYNSDETRNFRALGYTYPEIKDLPDQATLKKTLAVMYLNRSDTEFHWYYDANLTYTGPADPVGYEVAMVFANTTRAEALDLVRLGAAFKKPDLLVYMGFVEAGRMSRAFADITASLQDLGVQTDVPAKVPYDRLQGPAYSPIDLKTLTLVVLRTDDESKSFFNPSAPVYSLDVTDQYQVAQALSWRVTSLGFGGPGDGKIATGLVASD